MMYCPGARPDGIVKEYFPLLASRVAVAQTPELLFPDWATLNHTALEGIGEKVFTRRFSRY